jgi:phosphoribosylformimino-5-aminoimidazole carboxamide ribotide isomerase
MQIFPAIDLKDKQCVRLTQGDFSTAIVYHSDPLTQAQLFAQAGATWLHMVDLDGARTESMQQIDVITKVAQNLPLKLQVGGGIRQAETIDKLLAAGVTRVVIGSLAVKNQSAVQEWLRNFGPDRLVLAFDIRLDKQNEPEILTHGWQSGSNCSLWDVLKIYADSGLKTILCTDVSRDGMLSGTNHSLYTTLRQRWPHLDILASGGVSGLADLMQLAKLGLSGAIVGKAIYEGRVDLAAAIKRVKNVS